MDGDESFNGPISSVTEIHPYKTNKPGGGSGSKPTHKPGGGSGSGSGGGSGGGSGSGSISFPPEIIIGVVVVLCGSLFAICCYCASVNLYKRYSRRKIRIGPKFFIFLKLKKTNLTLRINFVF